MPEYGTKFSADWQISRGEWLSAARNEPSKALCRVCDKVFSVKNGGIRDVIKHEETTKHKKILRQPNHSVDSRSRQPQPQQRELDLDQDQEVR